MTAFVWLFLVFVLIAAAALVVVIVVFSRAAAPRTGHDGVRRVRTIIAMARVVAAVLAVRVVMDVAGLGLYGQGLALTPSVVAIVWVIGGIAAEMVTRSALRDGGAALEVRSLGRYLPRRGVLLLGLSTIMLVTTAIITTLLAGADGRSLTFACGPGCVSTRTPWPGAFYLAPLAVAFAVLLVLVAVNIRLAITRPRGHLADADRAADDATRSAAVAATLAVLALAVTATAAGVVAFGLLSPSFDPDAPPLVRLTLVTGIAAAVLAAVSAAGFLVTALSPRAVHMSRQG